MRIGRVLIFCFNICLMIFRRDVFGEVVMIGCVIMFSVCIGYLFVFVLVGVYYNFCFFCNF